MSEIWTPVRTQQLRALARSLADLVRDVLSRYSRLGGSQFAAAISYRALDRGGAGTPASHSLTSPVSVKRVGMASGTADLQRDLGGAIMQSIFGALLTAGYAAAAGSELAGNNVSSQTQAELTKSFASAADTAAQYPTSVQDNIVAGAKTAFLPGDQWAYLAGMVRGRARRGAGLAEVPEARRGTPAARRLPGEDAAGSASDAEVAETEPGDLIPCFG